MSKITINTSVCIFNDNAWAVDAYPEINKFYVDECHEDPVYPDVGGLVVWLDHFIDGPLSFAGYFFDGDDGSRVLKVITGHESMEEIDASDPNLVPRFIELAKEHLRSEEG